MKKRYILLGMAVMLLFSTTALTAADGFDFDIGIDYNMMDSANLIGISLNADIPLGKMGIGVKGTLRYDLANTRIMTEEWIPDFTEDDTILEKVQTAAALYLPVIRYVRYGWKGEPLYAQVGELEEVSLGTGIFVDEYQNTALQPTQKLTGALLDIDGELFGFPYIGIESFTSDVALLDIIGGRVYVKPFASMDFYMLHDFQVGGSMVVDRDPAAHDDPDTPVFTEAPEMVQMYGADLLMPILPFSFFTLDAFADYAFQDRIGLAEPASIMRAGLKGDIISLINYGAALTIPQTAGFVPSYFNDGYDLDRYTPYSTTETPGIATGNKYLNANAGFDLMDEKIIVDVSIDGELQVDSGSYTINNPDVSAYFKFGEGIIPYGFFDATYTKHIDGNTLDAVLDGVLDPGKSSVIDISATVNYSIIQTSVSGSITFDETGDYTYSAGLAALFNLF